MKGFMYHITWMLYFCFGVLFGKVQIKGRKNIPKDRNFIIVANHISLLDPWIISSIISPTTPVHWFTIEKLYDPVRVRKYLPEKYRDRRLGSILTHIVIFTMKHSHTIKVAFQLDNDVSENEKRRRKSINSTALKEAIDVLSKSGIVGIFPQRTRHGSVKEASSSYSFLARRCDVPIVPIHLSKGIVTVLEPKHIGRSCKKEGRVRITEKIMEEILP